MKKGAKQISLFFAIGLVAPFLSYASVTYSRDGGTTPTSPVVFHTNVTSASDLGGTVETFYCIDSQNVGFSLPEFVHQAGAFGVDNVTPISMPNGTAQSVVQLYPSMTGACDLADWIANGAIVEGDGSGIIFTVTAPSSPALNFQIMPTVGTATDMIAAVVGGVSETAGNMWLIAAVAIAIPLAFYALKNVAALFPKRYGKKDDPDIN